MNNIAVAMSTYNGEVYIGEQIESILKQHSVNVDLFIRDDGSKDKTNQILKTFAQNRKNIRIINGEI